MSSLYFSSPDAELEVSGSNLAGCHCIVNDISFAFIRRRNARERYENILPEDCYLRDESMKYDREWRNDFEVWWRTSGEECVDVGEKVRLFPLKANTAVVAGSDSVELAARIAATAEIHGYIEGENREWLADIVEKASKNQIVSFCGWLRKEGKKIKESCKLERFLRMRDDVPVVMSYSVCEEFPDPYEILGYDVSVSCEEDQIEAMNVVNDLEWDHYESWEKGMDWLRNNGNEVDMCPDIWGERLFEHEYTVFDLNRNIGSGWIGIEY